MNPEGQRKKVRITASSEAVARKSLIKRGFSIVDEPAPPERSGAAPSPALKTERVAKSTPFYKRIPWYILYPGMILIAIAMAVVVEQQRSEDAERAILRVTKALPQSAEFGEGYVELANLFDSRARQKAQLVNLRGHVMGYDWGVYADELRGELEKRISAMHPMTDQEFLYHGPWLRFDRKAQQYITYTMSSDGSYKGIASKDQNGSNPVETFKGKMRVDGNVIVWDDGADRDVVVLADDDTMIFHEKDGRYSGWIRVLAPRP